MTNSLSNALHAWADIATRQSMENNRKFIHTQGYSFAQMNSLFFIHHHKPVTVNALSCHMGISKGGASQMIERLVELGLVNREEDPEDRRSKILTLTEQGLAFVQSAKNARHAWIEQFCETIPPNEAESIAPAIERLLEHMKKYKETELETEK